MIKNSMETFVEIKLPELLLRYKDICKCEKCIEDIKAIALNNLKPLYSSSDKGNTYIKLNTLNNQFMTDVTKELTKAIEIVSKNQRHNL